MKKTTAYARKRSHQDAWQRTRHEACNPVTEAAAQGSMIESPRVTFTVVEQLSLTERGAGGFGSSGT